MDPTIQQTPMDEEDREMRNHFLKYVRTSNEVTKNKVYFDFKINNDHATQLISTGIADDVALRQGSFQFAYFSIFLFSN